MHIDLIFYIMVNQYFSNNIVRIEIQNNPILTKLNSNQKESKKFDYKIYNSLNIFSLQDKKSMKLEESLQENESLLILSKKKNDIISKNEEEINKLFTNFEITQSLIIEKNREIENFSPEIEQYLPQKTNIFQKIFRKATKVPTIANNELPENINKLSKNTLFKLQDDEIIEKILNNKNIFILNLWQNLPMKEKFRLWFENDGEKHFSTFHRVIIWFILYLFT